MLLLAACGADHSAISRRAPCRCFRRLRRSERGARPCQEFEAFDRASSDVRGRRFESDRGIILTVPVAMHSLLANIASKQGGGCPGLSIRPEGGRRTRSPQTGSRRRRA
jgi:hypothetical protein